MTHFSQKNNFYDYGFYIGFNTSYSYYHIMKKGCFDAKTSGIHLTWFCAFLTTFSIETSQGVALEFLTDH